MQVTIKKGVPERLEDYVDVMRDSALWDHYYVPDESLLRDTLRDGTVFIAETSSGEAAGLMICEWKGMFGLWPYLALLGVKKNYRGMGIGHQFLDTFEAIGRAMGVRNLFICVSGFNPRAKALYMSDLYKDGVNENVLMKKIGS